MKADFTPSTLHEYVQNLLEENHTSITIVGEVSNLTTSNSGHIYFELIDDNANVSCTYFKGNHNSVALKNGLQILITGEINLHPKRTNVQINAKNILDIGTGQKLAKLEELKTKLAEQGYFAQETKKKLPDEINTAIVITSSNSAALQDVKKTLEERNQTITLKLISVTVQGANAENEIIEALRKANTVKADCVLLVRGGGSKEDFQPYNTEAVVRAIHASNKPVITGLGHETDTTLADLAADIPAPTPTGAAQTITREKITIIQKTNNKLAIIITIAAAVIILILLAIILLK